MCPSWKLTIGGLIAVGLILLVGRTLAQQLFPVPGSLFRCDLTANLNGWQCNGGSLWGELRCCVAFFSPYKAQPKDRGTHNNNKLMLVLTKPVTYRPQGGADIEEVVAFTIIEKMNTELFEGDCTMNGIPFIYSVINKRTKTIIGISVNENGFEQYSFKWAAYPCNTEHVD
jgi:hypothetical protein